MKQQKEEQLGEVIARYREMRAVAESEGHKSIAIDPEATLADKELWACGAAAAGVYMVLITEHYPGLLVLSDTDEAVRTMERVGVKPRARLRLFADALNRLHPTKEARQTLDGLRRLYDAGIVAVSGAALVVAEDHNHIGWSE